MKMNYFLLFLALLTQNNCTSSESKEEQYKYFENFKAYLLEQHDLNILNDSDFAILIIPIGGCSSCVQESLDWAVENYNNEKFKTLIVSDSKKNFHKYAASISKINNENLLVESKGNDDQYELGIFGPAFLKISEGKVDYFISLDIDNINMIKMKYFETQKLL